MDFSSQISFCKAQIWLWIQKFVWRTSYFLKHSSLPPWFARVFDFIKSGCPSNYVLDSQSWAWLWLIYLFSILAEWCCVVSKLNDGVCDFVNNIPACNYDSLDCCQDGEDCPLQVYLTNCWVVCCGLYYMPLSTYLLC